MSTLEAMAGMLRAASDAVTCHKAAGQGPCLNCLDALDDSLARWRERAPLRSDEKLRGEVAPFADHGLESHGKSLTGNIDGILDALDSLLPSPPTRGAP